jgi:hypothetical protein
VFGLYRLNYKKKDFLHRVPSIQNSGLFRGRLKTGFFVLLVFITYLYLRRQPVPDLLLVMKDWLVSGQQSV